MNTSEKGKALIKKYEGLRLEAYICPAGVLTIGYGHTSEVKAGDKITESQAEELLVEDLVDFEQEVLQMVKSPLRQGQFDALVSFAYNLGSTNLRSSTLLKKVNTNPDDPTIAFEFGKWVRAGGRVLNGLVTRRAEESQLYYS